MALSKILSSRIHNEKNILALSKKRIGRVAVNLALSSGLAYLAFKYSGKFYLDSNPLFGVPNLGEGFIGILVLSLSNFFLPAAGKWTTHVIEQFISNIIYKVVFQVFRDAQGRLFRSSRERSKRSEKKSEIDAGSWILDTSAIIDGRILDIVKAGFVSNCVVVPEFVLDELQQVADSKDDLKRQRGRRGLDVLEEIRKVLGKSFKVYETSLRGDVDKLLSQLAKRNKSKIVTVDFNLNKAAGISGVGVLNVNDLANAIKTSILPGEKISIVINQKGKEKGQGVGYLDDGTMIVVENGGEFIGRRKKVLVVRVLQTKAGKMIFAKI